MGTHSRQAEPRAMIRAAELLVFWAVILSTSGAVTRREAESEATGEANLNYNYYDDYPAVNDYVSGPSFPAALPENQDSFPRIGGTPFPLGTDYGYPVNQGSPFTPNSDYQDFNPAPINQGAQFPSDYQDLNPAPINQGPQFLNPAPINQGPQFPSDYQDLNPAPVNQEPQFPSGYQDLNPAPVNQEPQFQTETDALDNFPVKSFVYFGDQTKNSGQNVKLQNENIQKKTTQNEAKPKSKSRPVNNIGTVLKKIGTNIGKTYQTYQKNIKNILNPAKNRKGREQD